MLVAVWGRLLHADQGEQTSNGCRRLCCLYSVCWLPSPRQRREKEGGKKKEKKGNALDTHLVMHAQNGCLDKQIHGGAAAAECCRCSRDFFFISPCTLQRAAPRASVHVSAHAPSPDDEERLIKTLGSFPPPPMEHEGWKRSLSISTLPPPL